jgi:hypothetical protein
MAHFSPLRWWFVVLATGFGSGKFADQLSFPAEATVLARYVDIAVYLTLAAEVACRYFV